jgi:hypothetical protein
MEKKLNIREFNNEEEIILDTLNEHYILNVIDGLQKINKTYTHIDIDVVGDLVKFFPFYLREETDEEFQKRVEEKERMMKNYLPFKEAIDRQEFERLKNLFYNEEDEYQRLKLKFENK